MRAFMAEGAALPKACGGEGPHTAHVVNQECPCQASVQGGWQVTKPALTVQPDFSASQVDPQMAEHTSAYLPHSLCPCGSPSLWRIHVDMPTSIQVQPTSAAVLSLCTICISCPLVTVSIQHLGTSVPSHAQHLLTGV